MAANDLCYTTTSTYESNLQRWIDAVKAAGHLPALIHPTWSQSSGYCPQNIPGFIAVVDGLVAKNGLPPAVPLYEATLNHPELLNSGDVHLNHAGCVVWQMTIAQWAAANFYGSP